MREKTRYKLNTVLAVLLVIGVLSYVGMRVLLPAYRYFLNKADRYKVQIVKEQRGVDNYLAVTPFNDFPYHKIEATLRSGKGFGQVSPGFEVYKDFMVQSYPIGETIATQEDLDRYLFLNNQTSLPNGTLVQNGGTVYFISKGQLRPFIGPEIFVRLNFDWDKILAEDDQIVSILPEGEKLDFVSAHPDGTILKTKQGKLFLVWEGERLPIQSEELLSKAWNGYYTVGVNSKNATPSGVCNIGNQDQRSRTIRCSFEPSSEFGSSTGQTYLFKLPKNVFDSLSDAQATFDVFGGFSEYELHVAKTSLKRIANKLYARYAGQLL